MTDIDVQTLKGLMAQQESAEGYLIPHDVMDGLIEEMKGQPKDRLFSEFMAEKGFLSVSKRFGDD